MASEVGSGQVPIFPTFKGFRRAVDAEVDSSSKSATSRFSKGFSSAGATAGKGFSSGFKSATTGVTGDTLARASAEVAKASRDVAAARLKELDVAGRVRIAETQLTEARARYASGSSQVVRAEERLAAQERALVTVQGSVASSTDRLTAAKRSLATATETASAAGGRMQTTFRGLPYILGEQGASSARRFSRGFLDVLGGALGANILTGVGFTIGRGINQGIGLALQTTFEGVQLANDLSETRSAIQQVFGDASSYINDFAEEANRDLGSTRQQALLGAQTFGVFAKQAGLTKKPLADFSTDLVQLAGDLASFYNTSPEDAIEAIGAGLRGESEPLRRYGVLLDDATLRQKALKLGIYDGSGALTQQQRILAAQAVIMEQTSIAQGDFERTSGGLANQQRILAATVEDTKAKFGEYLLPAFTSAATFANDTLLPALDGIVDKVGPIFADALDSAGPKVKNLVDELTPLAERLATIAAEDGIPALVGGFEDFVGLVEDSQWLWDPDSDFNQWFSRDFLGAGANFRKGVVDPAIEDFGRWVNSDTGGFLYGQEWGAEAAAGAKSGISEAGPFDFWSFGVGEKPDPQFYNFGFDAGTDAGSGAADAVADQDPFSIDSFIKHEDEFAAKGRKLGGDFGGGFAAGITAQSDVVARAGRGLGNIAHQALSAAIDAHSPSRKAFDRGADYGDGFALGMDSKWARVEKAARSMAAAAMTSTAPAPASASGSPAAGRTTEHIWQLYGVDPLVVSQMVKQEIAGRLATLP